MSTKQVDLLEVKRVTGIKGLTDRQRATFKGLGLTKNGYKVFLKDTNAARGMVNKVIEWVEVSLIAAADADQALNPPKIKRSKGYRVEAKA